MPKVLEDSLGNLEYLMAALTLLGVLYLCYKRSGLHISITKAAAKAASNAVKTNDTYRKAIQDLDATEKAEKIGMPSVPKRNIKNWNMYHRPTYEDYLGAEIAAQTADSPFDDSRLSLITYQIPTIVQEPRMSPDGHIIDSIERFRPHMKRV